MGWEFAEASPGNASTPWQRSPARPVLEAATIAKIIGAGLVCDDSYRLHFQYGITWPISPWSASGRHVTRWRRLQNGLTTKNRSIPERSARHPMAPRITRCDCFAWRIDYLIIWEPAPTSAKKKRADPLPSRRSCRLRPRCTSLHALSRTYLCSPGSRIGLASKLTIFHSPCPSRTYTRVKR